jgi:hypothetical protein
MTAPKLLAICAKQAPIDGDDALLRLAQKRLGEAGLGAELYPGSPEHLAGLLRFRPERLPCTAHLPRDIDLLQARDRRRVEEFARTAAGQLYGLVVHDRLELAEAPERAVEAFRDIDRALKGIPDAPPVFVEYAAGLEPDAFAELFEAGFEARRVSAAIDVGHVGIAAIRSSYRRRHPEQDACALRPDSPGLGEHIEDLQDSVAQALPTVTGLIRRLARLGKPLHFHLHDGHPLSTLSRFGVSDHLGFLQAIRLPFPYRGRHLIEGMFGLAGLQRILTTAVTGLEPAKLSFTLEMHPQPGRTPLREHAELFGHWRDRSNAEAMNYWLDLLLDNAALVRHGMPLVGG